MVTVTFAQPVLLPAPGTPENNTQIDGLVGFDVDGNFADGLSFPYCVGNFNVDFYVNMVTVLGGGRLGNGNYPIFNATSTKVGEATPFAGGNTLTLLVPIAAIGNHQSGPFNLRMVLGNASGPTDCAPNIGFISASTAREPLSAVPPLWRTWTHQ